MTAFAFSEEYPFFSDTNGAALDSGYVYIGTASLDPRTNPITVYWDKDLTIPAAQPLRTSAGSIVRSGTRSTVYIDATSYSVLVTNRNGVTVVNKPIMGGDAASDLSQSITLDVGTGGDFLTINAALAWLSPRRRTFGNDAVATINLLAGFTMAEQVLLNDGMDLGWITIVSEDSAVPIDTGFITETIDTEDGIIPVFGAVRNSILPIIGAKFEYANNTTSNDGVAVLFASKVTFLPGAGVVKARNGLKVLYGSHASCYMPGLTIGGAGTGAGTVTGVDFSYAANRGLHCGFNSSAGLARSNFSYAGGYAVYGIWGSSLDLYQSNMSHCADEAVYIRDGSVAACRECNVSDSLVGFHALHGAIIDARSRQIGTPEYTSWIGDGAKRCGTYAVLASFGSTVEAALLMCDDNISGRAVSATDASTINFGGGTATNANTYGCYADGASRINAIGADCSGAGTAGFYSIGGSVIAAASSKADNCGDMGLYAAGAGSCIDFDMQDGIAASATGCTNFGAIAERAAIINAEGANFSNCPRGIEAREASTINGRDITATGCTQRAVSCIDGGRINAQSATLTGAGIYGITSRGGEVVALGANCSGAGTYGVQVEVGGIVRFNSGTGTLSTAANAITANGIIFQ